MKPTISVVSALVAIPGLSAQAATINVSNFPDNIPVPIVSLSGTTQATGSIGIGTFTGDAHAFVAAGDFGGLQAAFQQFGDSVSIGFNGIPGLYKNTISAQVEGTQFSGQNVYTVIVANTDLQGLWGPMVIFDHGFNFVDEPGATPDAVIRADSNLVFGIRTQGDVGGQTFDGFQLNFCLACVPESSSAMLSLVGLSFLALRRRK